MVNQLDEGVSYFNYRGYYGVSGFGSSDVDAANNGYKLPYKKRSLQSIRSWFSKDKNEIPLLNGSLQQDVHEVFHAFCKFFIMEQNTVLFLIYHQI